MSLHSVLPTDVVFRMVQYIVDKSVARSLSPTFCKFFDQSILELTIGTSSDLDLLESNVYCPSLNALKHRLSGCKHLQKLVIHSTPFIDNEFIKWIHSTLTTLVWFEIVQCSKVTSSANEIYANNAKVLHLTNCWRAAVEENDQENDHLSSYETVCYQILSLLDDSEEGIAACASKRSPGNAHATGSVATFGQMIRLGFPIMMNKRKEVRCVYIILLSDTVGMKNKSKYLVVYCSKKYEHMFEKESAVAATAVNDTNLGAFVWDLQKRPRAGGAGTSGTRQCWQTDGVRPVKINLHAQLLEMSKTLQIHTLVVWHPLLLPPE